MCFSFASVRVEQPNRIHCNSGDITRNSRRFDHFHLAADCQKEALGLPDWLSFAHDPSKHHDRFIQPPRQ